MNSFDGLKGGDNVIQSSIRFPVQLEHVEFLQKRARKKRWLQAISSSLIILEFGLYWYIYQSLFRWKIGGQLTIDYIYLFLAQIAIFSFFAARKNLFYLKSPYSWVEELIRLFQAVFYTFMMIIGLLFLLKLSAEFSRAILILFFVGMLLVSWFTHLLRRVLVQWLSHQGVFTTKVIIVGAGHVGRRLADRLLTTKKSVYQLVGFLDDYKKGEEIKGSLHDLSRIIYQYDIDEIYITIPSERAKIHELLKMAMPYKSTTRIKIVPELYDLMTTKIAFEQLDTFPLVEILYRAQSASELRIKRMIDLILSLTILILLSPLFLVLSLLIWMDSPGPIFFRQTRIGSNGIPFTIYKFRTMVKNAEEKLRANPNLYNKYINNNYKLETHEDPRVTRIGKWLRKTSLDELPQLINVLKGEMSLVGPRPVVPEELKEYGDKVQDLLSVKPGMTGYWAAMGRSNIGYPERVNIELYYVYNQSLALDIKILLKTVTCVIKRDGAY